MALQNDLLLRTLKGENTERPPVWLMRQAGRILPQYRALRASLSGFIELVTTPDLAAEVTVQPVDELGVDAAIIFSDILVIPEVMGLPYEMIKGKGPHFPSTITSLAQIRNLDSGASAAAKLHYVYDALQETKKRLDNRVPLIGFAGAPWTLLAYMVEGGGSKTFSKAKALLYREPSTAHELLQKLTDTIIEYLKLKVKNGADVIQIFDSWAGLLSPYLFREFALPYLDQILDALADVPTILFAKGAGFALPEMQKLQPNALGLDWTMQAQATRRLLGSAQIVQGNLDPCVLYAKKDFIVDTTRKMIADFEGRHIVNLGHGVYPDTPLEGVKTFVNTVKSYKY